MNKRESYRILSLILGIVGLLLVSSKAPAQCDDALSPDGLTWDFDEERGDGFSFGDFMGGLLTPQLVQDTKKIRGYVRDERFAELLHRCGDLRAVDGIFQKALKISEFNIARALFLSMIGCLEHQNIKVDMPVVGAVGLPLTFEADSLFKARLENLPHFLYGDTPAGDVGDRDKLQHFFGSAYLSFVSESPEFARSVGNAVEWSEAKIIVGGADDPRDKRANKQGEAFGHDLLYVNTLLPSDYLSLPVRDE